MCLFVLFFPSFLFSPDMQMEDFKTSWVIDAFVVNYAAPKVIKSDTKLNMHQWRNPQQWKASEIKMNPLLIALPAFVEKKKLNLPSRLACEPTAEMLLLLPFSHLLDLDFFFAVPTQISFLLSSLHGRRATSWP